VVGHQYVAIGDMTTTAYRTGSPANASSGLDTATDETVTRDDVGGSWITDGFAVGDFCTIVGSTTANDTKLIEIGTLTATVLTATTVAALEANTGAGEIVTHAGEKILASSFGLSSITHAEILSQENINERYVITSPKDNGSYCYLYAFNTNADNNSTLLGASLVGGANVAAGATALGSIRLKVTGLL
tara:strand:- start:7602 stop:8165 length:564 start_codon:yes stop_codon:yes gene_type:complete